MIIIFCDGACAGNPGPGGWGAIVATPAGKVLELGGGAPRTTNNQMELLGAIEALRICVEEAGPVTIHTDSTYVIKGITQWIKGWKRNGWKSSTGNPVANRELWEALDHEVTRRGKGGEVSWQYVKGHSGNPGNERCDEIAVAYSKGKMPGLFRGSRSMYGIEIEKTGGSGGPGYISLVSGTVERHETWPECEARVRGKSGAKYKKVKSRAEEETVLREWGVK